MGMGGSMNGYQCGIDDERRRWWEPSSVTKDEEREREGITMECRIGADPRIHSRTLFCEQMQEENDFILILRAKKGVNECALRISIIYVSLLLKPERLHICKKIWSKML